MSADVYLDVYNIPKGVFKNQKKPSKCSIAHVGCLGASMQVLQHAYVRCSHLALVEANKAPT